jgi:hypothetical protein
MEVADAEAALHVSFQVDGIDDVARFVLLGRRPEAQAQRPDPAHAAFAGVGLV